MIKNILYLYTPSYVNVVAYLLQSNEYNARWFLKAYHKTDNFKEIARDMRPDSTQAFRAMKGLLWSITAFLYLGGLLLAVVLGNWQGVLTGAGLIVMTPVLSAYIVVAPLLLADWFVRKPRENKMIRTATEILQNHRAIKIAVVGSYGKTTMKEILSEIFNASMKVAATPGNYNTPVGISRFAAKLDGDEEILIIEMGEYVPGDIAKMCQMVAPDYAVITGINEQHMQRMETIQNTINAIFEVVDFVDKDKVLVNTDSELVASNKDEKNVTYNHKSAGSWKVSKVKTGTADTRFTATKKKSKLDLTSKLLGAHQVGPLMAGVYLASRLGVDEDDIVKGIVNTKPQGRRFNPRQLSNGALFIDDTYNGNPDGFLVGIDFLNSLKKEKTVYITGGIIELGEDKVRLHQMLGSELAKSKVDRILFIETPATKWMAEGFEAAGTKKKFDWVKPEAQIYDNLEQFTSDGEVVLMQNWQRENVFYEL